MRTLARSFWDFWEDKTQRTSFIIPSNEVNGYRNLGFELLPGEELLRIPIKPETAEQLLLCSIEPRSLLLEQLLIRSSCELVRQWVPTVKDSDPYKKAREISALLNQHPERLIWNGFCSGASMACRTLSILTLSIESAETEEGATDKPSIEVNIESPIGAQHAQFLRSFSKEWNLPSFSALLSLLQAPILSNDKFYLSMILSENIGAPEKRPNGQVVYTAASLAQFNQKFFTTADVPNSQGQLVRTIDLKIDAFSPEILTYLKHQVPVFACTAGPMLDDFIPFVLGSFETMVLKESIEEES